jgi:hypothetical protein
VLLGILDIDLFGHAIACFVAAALRKGFSFSVAFANISLVLGYLASTYRPLTDGVGLVSSSVYIDIALFEDS